VFEAFRDADYGRRNRIVAALVTVVPLFALAGLWLLAGVGLLTALFAFGIVVAILLFLSRYGAALYPLSARQVFLAKSLERGIPSRPDRRSRKRR
jgi:uncharacterized membrane protein YhiD involved in acid resistance